MLEQTGLDDPQPQDSDATKLTGKEMDIGSAPFDLAHYAKDQSITEKLYLNEAKDMYIEINVKSKLLDPHGQ